MVTHRFKILNNYLSQHTKALPTQDALERRVTPRIFDPFPATVQGVDINGDFFRFNTVLDNISAGGVYLRLMPCVGRGAKLSIVFQLIPRRESLEGTETPSVAVQGNVLRVEPKHGGSCGVAVSITHHQFL